MQNRSVVRGAAALAEFLSTRTFIGVRTTPVSRYVGTAALLSLVLSLSACTFSDLQSARLTGPGRWEVTPGYSSTSVSSEGETERVVNQFGVQVATGVTPRVDLRMRYDHIDFVGEDDDEGISILGFGPKFGLVEDRLALYAPVGFTFGRDVDSSESWQFQPTVLLTYPVNDRTDITASGRWVIWLLEDEAEDLVGANLGLGLSSDPDRWVIRPEVGFLKDPGEEGTLWQWSLGFSFFSGSGN